MEKKYDKILKSCSQKKSTIEVVFGIDKKEASIILILATLIIGLFLINWIIIAATKFNFTGRPTLSSIDIFCETFLLFLLELAVFFYTFSYSTKPCHRSSFVIKYKIPASF